MSGELSMFDILVCSHNKRFAHRYVQALRAGIRGDYTERRFNSFDRREGSTGSRA